MKLNCVERLVVVVVRSVDTIDLIKIWRAIRGFPFLLIVTSLTTTTTSIAFDRSTLNKAGRRGWNYLLQNDVYHTTTLKSRRGFPSMNSRKRRGRKRFHFHFSKMNDGAERPVHVQVHSERHAAAEFVLYEKGNRGDGERRKKNIRIIHATS